MSPIKSGSSGADEEKTLGDILDRINAAAPDKLRIDIADDGERLVIRDLTEGEGTFSIESAFSSPIAEQLGIAGESADGEITSGRLLGGLKSVLVSTLGGGNGTGMGELGALELTDRTGATDTIHLGDAETLEDVIDAINAANVGITASVNAAKNGIQLNDTTGGLASNLIIASADHTGTAEKLGLTDDEAVDSFNSGDLHQQVVSKNTKLADLNGGSGVRQGKIKITDSQGITSSLEIDSDVETIGDLIREINRLSANVYAEINETGDGIWIRDTGDGDGTLMVVDTNSTAAADLHLTGGAVTKEIDGEEVQVVDGSSTFTIELEEDETLEDLIDRINDLDGGVQAMSFVDGSRNPYRLSLTSETTGLKGSMVVDLSGLGFELQETVAATDALMVLGDLGAAATGVVISSSTNTFEGVIEGVRLTVNEASATAATITIDTSSTDLVANLETFVTNYNRFRESLDTYTAYNEDTEKASVLTGDSTALRLETDLSDFMSGRFLGIGSIQSLAQIGIDIGTDGTLTFDSTVVKDLFKNDREAVLKFFTTEESGFAAKFGTLMDRLTNEDNSVTTNRYVALGTKIEENTAKIEEMDARLEFERERLETQFYLMELAITKMQSNLDFISSIKYIDSSGKRNED